MRNRGAQSGFITIDFMFAIIMAWGLIVVFLSLTLTFTMFEVVQYIAFSTSRSFLPANVSPDAQNALAAAKFQQLISIAPVKYLLGNGYFKLDAFTQDSQTNYNDTFPPNTAGDTDQTFIGVRLRVEAKILEKQIPFLGPTYESEGGFYTYVTSFLGREVTEQECMTFNTNRYSNILNLTDSTNAAYTSSPNAAHLTSGVNSYAVITDNGC